MNTEQLYEKAISGESLSVEEGVFLYENAPVISLCRTADTIRRKFHPEGVVTWQIDRNVNITNVCISGCKFCSFHCRPVERDRSFITTLEQYETKIDEMLSLGGDQLLLQGGLHPALDINYYENLFRELKKRYPGVRLHALGAPEVFHIARISSLDTVTTLKRLIAAGLDSLPGAGAEILDSEVRRKISPAKCSAEDWLRVMGEAHRLGLATSATMMYGHIETVRNRVEHLVKLRELHSLRPEGTHGFVAFIAWPFCGNGTELINMPVFKEVPPLTEYLRIVAISRIMLPNIANIQASYLTVGVDIARVALHCGANDLGSIMIEENVVSSTGVSNIVNAERMEKIIREAGFTPQLRDQLYNYR